MDTAASVSVSTTCSYLRTTMKYYVDKTRFPLREAVAKLPSFSAPHLAAASA